MTQFLADILNPIVFGFEGEDASKELFNKEGLRRGSGDLVSRLHRVLCMPTPARGAYNHMYSLKTLSDINCSLSPCLQGKTPLQPLAEAKIVITPEY